MNRADADSLDQQFAGERTDLAWNRSGLAILACGAIILRGITTPPFIPARAVVGVVILLLGLVVWFLGVWQNRRRSTAPRRVAQLADLLPVTIGTAAVGVAAFVIGFLGGG